jgi:hypothetical protein
MPVILTLRSRPLWAQATQTPSAMMSMTHASHAAGGTAEIPIAPSEPQKPSRWYWRDEPQNKARSVTAETAQTQAPSRWYWRH